MQYTLQEITPNLIENHHVSGLFVDTLDELTGHTLPRTIIKGATVLMFERPEDLLRYVLRAVELSHLFNDDNTEAGALLLEISLGELDKYYRDDGPWF